MVSYSNGTMQFELSWVTYNPDFYGAYENASTENEVEMLANASTYGATIDGSRCETDITKHPKTCELKK